MFRNYILLYSFTKNSKRLGYKMMFNGTIAYEGFKKVPNVKYHKLFGLSNILKSFLLEYGFY